ncbi:MAG: hypothetical protein FWC45_01095, partial [Treponema sp.]|nr:hypothetical protein [Treponema sp.]
MEIKEYKCPNCGGAVKFDSSSQKMKCPFCGTEFEVSALEEYQKDLQTMAKDRFGWAGDTEADKEWKDTEIDDLAGNSCPSCGAELIGDKNTAATVCPCCGNNQIVSRRLTGLLKPDFVIPFKLDKKAAVEALKNFCKGKRLLPKFFIQENHIGSIQGMYVPFWLFDAKAQGNVRYRATKMAAWSDNSYDYTKTDHYSIVRDGSITFEKIPVDGSEKMDDSYMDSIEPFDYTQLKDFEKPYLAGYLAEKYDVDAGKSKERANQRIKTTVESEFAKSIVGFTSVTPESSSIQVEDGKVWYSLFPVWILNTKYRKENFVFMMNGQSGLLAGRLPVDP